LRSEKSGLSGVEIRRTGLFIFHLRIGVVGGCEHRLLVDSSQMKVDDRGGPTALFEFCRVDFQITSGSERVADFCLHQVAKENDPRVIRIRLHVFLKHLRALCHSPQVKKQETLGAL
jgi:hypothetical protein